MPLFSWWPWLFGAIGRCVLLYDYIYQSICVVIPMGEDVCEVENNVHYTTYNDRCHKTFCEDKHWRIFFPSPSWSSTRFISLSVSVSWGRLACLGSASIYLQRRHYYLEILPCCPVSLSYLDFAMCLSWSTGRSQGPVSLLQHDAVARILVNGSAAFIESYAAIGGNSCGSVRSL